MDATPIVPEAATLAAIEAVKRLYAICWLRR
jgi:hypothetical protein